MQQPAISSLVSAKGPAPSGALQVIHAHPHLSSASYRPLVPRLRHHWRITRLAGSGVGAQRVVSSTDRLPNWPLPDDERVGVNGPPLCRYPPQDLALRRHT
jgi:D-alanyl-D-alanine carboxypeptidase